jgi:hypothetical protein
MPIGGKMDEKKLLKASEELKKLRKPIQNVNIKHKESLSALEKIAVKVTDYVNSMGVFLNNISMDPFMAWLEYSWANKIAI